VAEELPRLLDPAALDAKKDPRGRASIVVPTEWLRDGARLEVEVPSRLRCDLCDGGGCDACGRSGAYKLPEDRPKVAVTLPRVTDDVIALRVTNPFGDATPALLVVRVAAGREPSTGVTYVGPNHDVEPVVPETPLARLPHVAPWVRTTVFVALAAIAAVVARVACG
jgi:hypothetical protein